MTLRLLVFCFVRGRFFRSRRFFFGRFFVRTAAVIRAVKPRAFENDAGSSSEQSLHFTATPLGKAAKVFGTFAQRLVAHGLEGVEVLPAFLAGVFISGHR